MAKKPKKTSRRIPPPEDRRPALIKRNGDRQMPMTDVDRFLQEEEERAQRRKEMIDALLDERDEKMAEYDAKLKRLGYTASVVGSAVRAVKSVASGITRTKSDVACKTCGYKTDPLHDARAHRSQSPKAPFTHDELVARGLSKIA